LLTLAAYGVYATPLVYGKVNGTGSLQNATQSLGNLVTIVGGDLGNTVKQL
jgi:hypothetical protein